MHVTTKAGEFWTKYTTFGELAHLLDPQMFHRVHRQAIVNINHIHEVTPFDNNTANLTLTGGRQVSVSRNHMKELRRLLDG